MLAAAVLAAVLLSVQVGAPFGAAEATAVSTVSPFEVALTVEVDGAWEAVLVRMVSLGGELEPVAMVPRTDGVWGATVRLTAAEDVLVAFEAVASRGDPVISRAHRLSTLGIDPALFAPASTTTEGVGLGIGNRWLLAGLAAALLSIALVAVWALSGGRSAPGGEPEASSADTGTDPPPT